MDDIMDATPKKRILTIVASLIQKDPDLVALSKAHLRGAVDSVDVSRVDIDETLAIGIALHLNEMISGEVSLGALRAAGTAASQTYLTKAAKEKERTGSATPATKDVATSPRALFPHRARRPMVPSGGSAAGVQAAAAVADSVADISADAEHDEGPNAHDATT